MIAKRSVPLPLVITTVNIESSTGTLFISLTSFHSLALTIISTRHVHRQKSKLIIALIIIFFTVIVVSVLIIVFLLAEQTHRLCQSRHVIFHAVVQITTTLTLPMTWHSTNPAFASEFRLSLCCWFFISIVALSFEAVYPFVPISTTEIASTFKPLRPLLPCCVCLFFVQSL